MSTDRDVVAAITELFTKNDTVAIVSYPSRDGSKSLYRVEDEAAELLINHVKWSRSEHIAEDHDDPDTLQLLDAMELVANDVRKLADQTPVDEAFARRIAVEIHPSIPGISSTDEYILGRRANGERLWLYHFGGKWCLDGICDNPTRGQVYTACRLYNVPITEKDQPQ